MTEYEYQENAAGLTREQIYANMDREQKLEEKRKLLARMSLDESGLHILNRQLGIKDDNEGGEWIG